MSQIPDTTQTETWIVETTLKERYGEAVDLRLADCDIRLQPSDREVTSTPAFFWTADDCHFVIFKTAEKRYRCQFYYRGYQQYGTGIREYDDLTECVVSLLQAQADYVAEEAGDISARRRR